MDKYPLVSCVCPTFGKVKHLNEAVYSFLIQTYTNKELIIFNNYAEVDIVFDHPQVKIINYKGIITGNTAECRNLGNQYASGEYIMTWDDDDIYLKDRIRWMTEVFLVDRKAGGCNIPQAGINLVGTIGGAYYSEGNVILKKTDTFLSNTLINKEFLLKNPYKNGDADDQYMRGKMNEGINRSILSDTLTQYIYRWATDTYHISGAVGLTLEENRNKMIKWANSLGLPPIVHLSPYWERDYQLDVDNFNSTINK